MIVRLKYNEKPEDESLKIKRELNRFDSESDVVWMSYDEFMKKPILITEDADIPEEIKAFIPKWREEAAEIDNGSGDYCPIKGAGSDIYYNGEKYYVDTTILHGIGKGGTVDWVFDLISRDIEKDLYSIGATYVDYRGMVD